jgi:excisionase family DNA binding protein
MDANENIALSLRECARILGCSYGTLLNRIHTGEIPARRLSSKQYVVMRSDLQDYLLRAPLVAPTPSE